MSAWTVDLEIHRQDGTSITITVEAVEKLCALMPMVASVPSMLSEVKAKAHLPFPVVNKAPEILIGADYLSNFDIVHKEELANGFHLYDSSVGPLVYGKGKVSWKKGTQAPQQVNMIYRLTIEEQALPEAQGLYNVLEKDQLLAATEKLWSVEALGIEAPGSTQEADAVLQNHKDTLKRLPDGRYEVAFPLREAVVAILKSGAPPRSILPDNQKAAFARLFSVWKTYLANNPQLRDAYSKSFAEQLERGIIEIVEDHKLDPNKLYHYLAHHPVFREDKPTKLRIVFDGSARSGPDVRSLNDCLHPGPSMLESLVGILLSCRLTSLLIIGDIEKAFLQISVRPGR
ncbi:Pao retrotransposon peptidase family protein [Aphelenchoides avenae]|nr:Pao retrotransposon peptidase family protein [Aphelenchus avenae]